MIVLTGAPDNRFLGKIKQERGDAIQIRSVTLNGQDYTMVSAAYSYLENQLIQDLKLSSDLEYQVIEHEAPLSRRGLLPAYEVNVSPDIRLTGDNSIFIAGPCAVEAADSLYELGRSLSELGIRFLRGGAFKPRTSHYSFSGMERQGLISMRAVADEFSLLVVTEARSETEVELVADYADIIQIGAKSSYNFTLLKEAGRSGKPVLLKRGFMMTTKELLQASDVVLGQGNKDVLLCERGIRTFETATRFTLDLTAVAHLKRVTHLPIVVDPSHAAGDRRIVRDLSMAAAAMGVDGIMVEVHPDPDRALCDAAQAFPVEQLSALYSDVRSASSIAARTLL